MIEERIREIEERIDAACTRAGRSREEVRLVAVSKTRTAEEVAAAAAAGLRIFGENRVQEAQAKIPLCPARLEWHLIGHVQGNKAKIAASGLFCMIHSVDSEKVLRRLDAHAAVPLPVLIQVNVSGEASKSGCAPERVMELVEVANGCARVEVHGLMTIPPFVADPAKVRPVFADLRHLRDRVAAESGTPLPELSMGMSHDFEVAIEEGATMIRVGTDLFGPR